MIHYNNLLYLLKPLSYSISLNSGIFKLKVIVFKKAYLEMVRIVLGSFNII